MVNHSELVRVSESGGQTLVVYSAPDRLELHLLDLSQADHCVEGV